MITGLFLCGSAILVCLSVHLFNTLRGVVVCDLCVRVTVSVCRHLSVKGCQCVVCVSVRKRADLCVSVTVCFGSRISPDPQRERERERVCVCVRVTVSVCMLSFTSLCVGGV